jgi:hypothetical protein
MVAESSPTYWRMPLVSSASAASCLTKVLLPVCWAPHIKTTGVSSKFFQQLPLYCPPVNGKKYTTKWMILQRW